MKCIKCNSELQVGARFCNRCGTKQPELLQCSKCGKSDIRHDAVFCPKCGNRVSTTNKTEEEKTANTWKECLDKSKNEVLYLRDNLTISERDISSLKEDISSLNHEVYKLQNKSKQSDELLEKRLSEIETLETELSSVKTTLSHYVHRANELYRREKELEERTKGHEKNYKERCDKLSESEAKVRERERNCSYLESQNRRLWHNISVMENGGKEKWWIEILRILCLAFAIWNIGAFIYSDTIMYLDKPFPKIEDWWKNMGIILGGCLFLSFLIYFVIDGDFNLSGSKFIRWCASLTPLTLWNVYPFFTANGKDEVLIFHIAYVIILFGVCGALFCATTYIRNKVYFDSDLE